MGSNKLWHFSIIPFIDMGNITHLDTFLVPLNDILAHLSKLASLPSLQESLTFHNDCVSSITNLRKWAASISYWQ